MEGRKSIIKEGFQSSDAVEDQIAEKIMGSALRKKIFI